MMRIIAFFFDFAKERILGILSNFDQVLSLAPKMGENFLGENSALWRELFEKQKISPPQCEIQTTGNRNDLRTTNVSTMKHSRNYNVLFYIDR